MRYEFARCRGAGGREEQRSAGEGKGALGDQGREAGGGVGKEVLVEGGVEREEATAEEVVAAVVAAASEHGR